MVEGNQADWRELCAAAAKEPNSDKLLTLVTQILEAFDERDGKPANPSEDCS